MYVNWIQFINGAIQFNYISTGFLSAGYIIAEREMSNFPTIIVDLSIPLAVLIFFSHVFEHSVVKYDQNVYDSLNK